MRNKIGRAMACFLFTGLFVGLAGPAWASPCPFPFFTGTDGVCQISQPLGRFPGNPRCIGFPITITSPGSYRLATNLSVTCLGKDAIDVTASSGLVTIDLNGFSIIGPGSGTGVGIKATFASGSSFASLVVHNGEVAAMGTGILALECKVEEVHLLFNAGDAVNCAPISSSTGEGVGMFLNNTVIDNDNGILGNGIVQGNNVTDNLGEGIVIAVGTVTENFVAANLGDGIVVSVAEVGENSVFENGGDGILVSGTCPGGCAAHVIGNTVDANGGFGIRFSDASGGFTSNVVNGNGNSPACATDAISLNCNSQVCGGVSPFGATSNVCNGMQG